MRVRDSRAGPDRPGRAGRLQLEGSVGGSVGRRGDDRRIVR